MQRVLDCSHQTLSLLFFPIQASFEGYLMFFVMASLLDKRDQYNFCFFSILKVETPKRVIVDLILVLRNSITAAHLTA